jgi:hypothetical protein
MKTPDRKVVGGKMKPGFQIGPDRILASGFSYLRPIAGGYTHPPFGRDMKIRIVFFHLSLLLAMIVSFSEISSADPLDHWHWRNPVPPSAGLYGVSYGNGTFVAVGLLGTIFTSSDGNEWKVGDSGRRVHLFGVAYGKEIFAAVGDAGRVTTSIDGIDWVDRDSGTSEELFGIIFAQDRFISVGAKGTVITSSDGIRWEATSVGKGRMLSSIAWGNDIFIAAGYTCDSLERCSGSIFTSRDTIHWEHREVDADMLLGVTHGKGTFVVVGDGGAIFTSWDGISWERRNSKTFNLLAGVTFGNDTFVTVGQGVIVVSNDGVEWNEVLPCNILADVIWKEGLFVAVGIDNAICVSPDGAYWTGEIHPGIRLHLRDIEYGNDAFVASVGEVASEKVMISAGGDIWTQVKSDFALFEMAYGKGIFAAIGGEMNNLLLSSHDGRKWSQWYSAEGIYLCGIAFGNEMFIAVGFSLYGGQDVILTSENGIRWTQQVLETKSYPGMITFGNGIFLVSCSNQRWTSRDGKAWTISGRDSGPYMMAYGDGLFVGFGENCFWTSPDGMRWNKRKAPKGICPSRIAYGGGTFIAIGNLCTGSTAFILTSSDGVTWVARVLESFMTFTGVTYGNGTFVVVGERGVILQSDPLEGIRISADRSSIDFGSIPLGDISDQSLTVRNDGTEDLIVGAILIPALPFSIVDQNCSERVFGPGETCSINVRFAPGSTGSFNGRLEIPSNDPDRPNLRLPLGGSSIAPDLRAEFTSLSQTCTSKCKIRGTLNISNAGALPAVSALVKFYRSDSATSYFEDGFLNQISTGTIKAKMTKTKRVNYTLPTGESVSGEYIIAVMDADNTIKEGDETNNRAVYGPIP